MHTRKTPPRFRGAHRSPALTSEDPSVLGISSTVKTEHHLGGWSKDRGEGLGSIPALLLNKRDYFFKK